MYTFYQIFDNKEYNDAFQFSFGFNGYYNLLHGLNLNISNLKINKTTFLLGQSVQTETETKPTPY
jgi:hypothetical protein